MTRKWGDGPRPHGVGRRPMGWGDGISAACSKPTRTAAAELRDGAISACCPPCRRLRVAGIAEVAVSAGAPESSPPESSPQPLEGSCRAGAEHVQRAKHVDWRAWAWRLSHSRIPERAVCGALLVRPCVDESRARRQRRRRSPGGRRYRQDSRQCGRRYRRRRRAAENGRGRVASINQSGSVREWQRRRGI